MKPNHPSRPRPPFPLGTGSRKGVWTYEVPLRAIECMWRDALSEQIGGSLDPDACRPETGPYGGLGCKGCVGDLERTAGAWEMAGARAARRAIHSPGPGVNVSDIVNGFPSVHRGDPSIGDMCQDHLPDPPSPGEGK